MKRILAVVLTLCMLISLFPAFPVFAATTSTTDEGIGFDFANEFYPTVKSGNDLYHMSKPFEVYPHTYEALICFPETPTEAGVLMGNSNDDGGEYVNIEVTKGGSPLYRFFDGRSHLYTITFSDVNLYTGEWIYLTIVHDPDTNVVSCYVDGELKQTAGFYPDYNDGTFNMPLVIGGDLDYQNNPHFKGRIKGVTLYSDARTATEIASDFESGADLKDENLLCDFTMTSDFARSDIVDNAGNGYDLIYSDLWVEPEDVEAWRESTGMDRAYSFAVIGDIQYSTEFWPEKLTPMYQWIVDNKEENKTVYSIGLGDITNRDSEVEWIAAENAMDVLENGGVPYSVIRGNHDLKNYSEASNVKYHTTGSNASTSNVPTIGGSMFGAGFDKYFSSDANYTDQFFNNGDNGGTYEEGSALCSWRILEVAKTKWLLLNLDYAPSDSVLEWASGVVESHPDCKVLVSTHGYLDRNGDHAKEGAYVGEKGASGVVVPGGYTDYNLGVEIWEKFVSQHENIEIVVCGHISSTVHPVAQRKGVHGNTVTEILVDGQSIDDRYNGISFVTMFYFNEDGTELEIEHFSTEVGKYYRSANLQHIDLTAEGEEYDPDIWNDLQIVPEGSGTKAEPYIVNSAGNLHWMSMQVSGGETFAGKYFKQTCNIDLSNHAVNNIGVSDTLYFGGIYDGQGYSIKNGTISCVVNNTFTKEFGYGLFGAIKNATIKNVTLDNMEIVGRGITGAIVGKAIGDVDTNNGYNIVSNCVVKSNCDIVTLLPNGTATPTDADYDDETRAGIVGGIVGSARSATVENCSVENDISVSGVFGTVGGIAGAAGYNTVIKNCLHSGAIFVVDNKSAKDVAVGGIVGMTSPTLQTTDGLDDSKQGMLHIIDCANEGQLKYTGTEAISVYSSWGGILGATGRLYDIEAGKYTATSKPTVADTPAYMIKNCFNSYALATTPGDNTKGATGGLVGRGYAISGSQAESTLWLIDSASVRVTRTAGGVNGYNSYNYKNYNTKYTLKVIDVALEQDGTVSVSRDSNATGQNDIVSAGVTGVKNTINNYRNSITGELRWSFDEETATLAIEGIGEIADYEIDAQPWSEYKTVVENVNIGDAVTAIGANAFNGFENLTSVTVSPDLESVGEGAFEGTAFVNDSANYTGNVLYVGNIVIKAISCDDNTYTLNAKTTVINNNAFANVTADVIYFGGSSAQWSAVTIGDGNDTVADAQFVYEGNDVNYLFDPDTGVLRVFGSGKTSAFSSNSDNQPYYRFKDKITSIVVEEGITALGNYLAKGYTNVTSVTLPEGLTSIGTSCFEGHKITSIKLPETLVTIGNYAFNVCTELTTVDIPASVKNVNRYAFYNCSKLAAVTGGENISSMGQYAFQGTPFKNNTANYEGGVLYAGNAVVIAQATANNAYTIKAETTAIAINAFSGLTVSTVYYGGEETDWANISIGSGNDALDSATFHYGTLSMAWEFDETTGTLTISGIGATPDYNSTSSNTPWYEYKDQITSVVIEEGITALGNYFAKGFSNITTISLPNGLTKIGTGAFQGASVTEILLPETLTAIGNYGFYGTKLTTVDIPASVTIIDQYCFNNCTKLETVTGGEGITSAESYVFTGTPFVKNQENYQDGILYVGNAAVAVIKNEDSEYTFKAETVAVASNVFNGVEVSVVNFGGNRTQWSAVSFGSGNTTLSDAQVIYAGESYNCLFDYETGILRVFGTGATPAFPNDASTAPWYKYVDLVTEVVIEDGITVLGNHAFKNFTKLEKVTLPSTLTKTGSAVFENTAIKSIVIPEGVTALGNYNFHKVKTLESIYLPESVTSIGKSSFLSSGLKTVYYYGTAEQFAAITVNATGNNIFTAADVVYMGDFEIRKTSVTINNDLSVNFKVFDYLFNGAGYENPVLTVGDEEITDYVVSDGMAIFTVDGIAPHKMGDAISITLSATKDGEQVNTQLDFVIADYLNTLLVDYADDEELVTLVVDTLNYGAAAQTYKGYDIENLVNASLTDEQKAVRDAGEMINSISISDDIEETAMWKSHALYLEDSFEIKLAFETDAQEVSVIVKDTDGNIIETITEISKTPYGKYYFYYDGLTADQMDDVFTFTVMSGEEQISESLTYSAMSYIALTRDNETLAPLVNALAAYGRSAFAYSKK